MNLNLQNTTLICDPERWEEILSSARASGDNINLQGATIVLVEDYLLEEKIKAALGIKE